MNIDLNPHQNLEDLADAQTGAWVKTQAERAEQYFASLPVRERLRQRFRDLFSSGAEGVPVPRGNKYFFTRRKKDQDMWVLYVQDGLAGVPRVLIDPNNLSKDKTVVLTESHPSPDGGLLAYCLSQAGNDKKYIGVLDVATGERLSDLVSDESYPSFLAWNADGTGFWYRKHDPSAPAAEAKLHQRLYFHRIGDSTQGDILVFGNDLEKDHIPYANLSSDGRFLVVGVHGTDKATSQEWTEVYLHDTADADGKFVLVIKRTPGSECYASVHRETLYLSSNLDAPLWQILAMPVTDAMQGRGVPRILIPQGKGRVEDVAYIGDSIFVSRLENVYSVVREYSLDGQQKRVLPLPIGSAHDRAAYIGFSYEPEGKELFFPFQSFSMPPRVYRLDLSTGEMHVHASTEAGFDVNTLATEQVWYSSKDGTKIPMFLVYKKGLRKDGANPTVLYGYGGFDISLTPTFMRSVVPFVEQGGIFAIANLRGGGEFGEKWHQGGMQKNKQNVFDDFAAAARWLIDTGYTSSKKLAIEGGSNGGLLTMVTITQHPDLVAAAIAHVPVTDMLRYHLYFGGMHWIPDYGNPDEPEMRSYLLGYSPYHNVRDRQKYPAVLITTSDSDDRVHPMHSYKMAARLQEANTSEHPILLRVELKSGHSGSRAISKLIERLADTWSFVFDQLKIE